MDDNKGVSCPIRGFSPAEFQPSSNIYNSENQNNSSEKEDKKDNWFGGGAAKESGSLILPKMSHDSQDELSNPDLHNGHNNPHAIDIKHRNRSLGELLEESKDLPDTVLMDCSKDYSSTKASDSSNTEKENESNEGDKGREEELEENSRDGKATEDIASQDLFEDNDTNGNSKLASSDKNDVLASNTQDTQLSEGFDLHLSETQAFLPLSEKEKENRESEDSNPTEESNGKGDDLNDDKSSENLDSKNESLTDNPEESVSKDSSNEKECVGLGLNTEDISNGSDDGGKDSVEETKASVATANKEESKEENVVMDISDSEEKAEESSEKKESDDGKASENLGDDSKDESSDKAADAEDEPMEVEERDKEGEKEQSPSDPVAESDKVDGEGNEVAEPSAPPKTPARSQRKRQNNKDESTVESNHAHSNETEETSKNSDEAGDALVSCSCQPACHSRIETVSEYLNSACSQLEDFIKLKRRDENKNLKNFLDMLKEITSVSQNKQVVGETKIGEHILIPEETPPKRKSGIKRKSSDAETPLKETPRKRSNTEDKSTKKAEKKSNVDFKDLKGLAVFAKWPNSGWYYPGKVEELSGSDWKEANNVTVKFYDGLVRDMKNINILPAYLIPPGSMLSDLDDETEMVVLSCDGSNQNNVDFKLGTKDNSGREIEMNFNKLAIKANHMKTIKQQLEPTTDVLPKKMHMVSLDNLVSGRRSRGRSKKDGDSADEKTPSNQTERRSAGASASTPTRKSATPKRARN